MNKPAKKAGRGPGKPLSRRMSESFDRQILAGLRGEPLINLVTGEPMLDADGQAITRPCSARFLDVVRRRLIDLGVNQLDQRTLLEEAQCRFRNRANSGPIPFSSAFEAS